MAQLGALCISNLCATKPNQGAIAYEEALRNADSVNELRLQIKLKSSRANPQLSSNSALSFDQAIAEKAKDAEEEKADA